MRKHLVLGLCVALVVALATPALAIIPCEFCDGFPDTQKCSGMCNGYVPRTCGAYRALGCTGWLSTGIPELELEAPRAVQPEVEPEVEVMTSPEVPAE